MSSRLPGALPRGGQVDRPRLLGRLRRRFDVRLTTIVGGGGSGKTTLLAQAIGDEAEHVDVWYPCSPADRSSAHLAAALLEAARRTLGGDPDAPEGDPVELIADLVLAVSPRHVCLVLDDTQLLPDGEVVANLLDALPSNGHLLVAGRRALAIPTARLDAAGQLEQVPQSDLMMTAPEEIAFANIRGVDVDVLKGAEGWPAFMELATRAHGSDPRDYLEQEALATLDPQRRHDLAALAVVGGGDDDVAVAVTGRHLSEIVEELPLVRWTGSWAQLHDLWGELLADELSGDERIAAAVAAAGAARRGGDVERAISLCAETGAWDELLTTLEHAVEHGMVGGLRPRLLARWRSTIPARHAAAPVARLLDGLTERERDPTTAEASDALDEAAHGFRAAHNAALELVALSHLGYVARISGVADRVISVQRRIAELAERHPPAEPFVQLCDAWLALVRGRPHDQLTAVESLDASNLPALWRATRDHLLAHALSNLGRPHEALAAVPHDIESRRLAIPGAVSTEFGAHWWAGHPEIIFDWLTEGLGPEYGARDRFVTNVFLAFCRANAGDVPTSRRLIAMAEDGAGEAPAALIAAQLEGVRMVLDVVTGDESSARDRLSGMLDRLPLGGGVSEHILRSFVSFPYVLLPDTRHFWDTADLGPSIVTSRLLAAALVAAREHDDLGPIVAMAWPEPGVVAARLPVNWAIELAIHGERAGRYEAVHLTEWLCEHWGRPARQALALLRDHDPMGRAASALLSRTPAPPQQPIALRVLGETRLMVNDSDTADPDWRRERVRALLAWLALHPDSSRNRIAAALWPDLEPERAAKNLRTTLNYLHGVLEPQRSSGDATWFVRSPGQQVSLHASLDVDLWRFRDLLDRADEAERRGRPTEALPLLVEACRSWHGDLAADLDHEWLELERIHVRGRFVRAACRAAELLVATGRAAEAVEVVRPAIEVDRWNDRAYEALAAGYRAMGDLTSARAVESRADGQRAALLAD